MGEVSRSPSSLATRRAPRPYQEGLSRSVGPMLRCSSHSPLYQLHNPVSTRWLHVLASPASEANDTLIMLTIGSTKASRPENVPRYYRDANILAFDDLTHWQWLILLGISADAADDECLMLKFEAPTLRYSEEDPLRVYNGSPGWPCVLAAGEQPYIKFDVPLQEQRSMFTITPAGDGSLKLKGSTHPFLMAATMKKRAAMIDVGEIAGELTC
ncbi:uncharacterized protein LOC135826990 [Sycon ciliatum]|uniref:uncharacterized protein LOC135826990 n=1 Tax=Sycon ciliatum TaxID=27933 RepID=UPI0031F647EB